MHEYEFDFNFGEREEEEEEKRAFLWEIITYQSKSWIFIRNYCELKRKNLFIEFFFLNYNEKVGFEISIHEFVVIKRKLSAL